MKNNTGKLSKILVYTLLILGIIIAGFPLLYAFFGSFKSTLEFLGGGSSLLPKKWRLQNYVDAWKSANFGVYTFNSIWFAFWSVVGTVITTTLTGYVLSRKNFFGKKILLTLFAATMFVSGAITLFPIFKLCKDMNLTKTLWGLIIAQIAVSQPIYCILVMGYTDGIPREIDESAKIDGCGFFRIYWNMILPLIKPIIATVVILQFRDAWNNFMMPLAFTLSNSKLRTLTVGVVQLKDQGEGISSWNLMIAGTVMSLIPIMVVYLSLNRYFIGGITDGAVKG